MNTALMLVLALLLDALLGEPEWLWRRFPHPAVLMGRAVGWCDRRFNKGEHRFLRGTLCMAALMTAALVLGLLLGLLGPVVEIIVGDPAGAPLAGRTRARGGVRIAPVAR